MTATEARQTSNQNLDNDLFQEAISKQNTVIQEAIANGAFQASWCVDITTYDKILPKLERHYRNLGYRFKPVGVMGGVLQRGHYICW